MSNPRSQKVADAIEVIGVGSQAHPAEEQHSSPAVDDPRLIAEQNARFMALMRKAVTLPKSEIDAKMAEIKKQKRTTGSN